MKLKVGRFKLFICGSFAPMLISIFSVSGRILITAIMYTEITGKQALE